MPDDIAIAADIGHNRPPPLEPEVLRAQLEEEHVDLVKRRKDLLAAIERAPATVDDEETAGKMADFAEQINGFIKTAKEVHQGEKAPFLTAGRTVDAFLHHLIDKIEDGKKTINSRRKAYADKKAAEERRRRQEEEQRAREEAERAAREAAEAAAKLQEESDLEAAIAAEEEAERKRKEAEAAAKAAAAKPAELGRSRGDYGGMTSLKQFWNFRNMNRDTLDLNALRAHFRSDDLEFAIRQFIKAGGRKLEGVEIFEDTRL